MLAEAVLLGALFLVFSVAELVWPVERGHTLSGRARNLGWGLLLVVSGGVFAVVVSFLVPLSVVLPDRGWGCSLGYLFAYLGATDLGFYWYHRLQHWAGWAWWLHSLHHSDAELNVTTSVRTFFLDRPVQVLLIALPIRWFLGVDLRAVLLFSVVAPCWLCFTHANLRLSLGPFTPWLCGPQLHRIHHSRLPQHRDKNFAQFFPVLDVVFGTYCAPGREFPPTGEDEGE